MYRWTVDLDRVPGGDHRVAVAVGQDIYAIGFFKNLNDHLTTDMHVFNTVSLRWTKLPPLTIPRGECPLDGLRSYFPDVALLIDGIVYILGFLFNHNQFHFMLFAFDLESRRLFKPEVSGNGPEVTPCGRAAACVSRRVIYVFLTDPGRSEICKLDTTTMVWSFINARGMAPCSSGGEGGRNRIANIPNIIGTKMFVVGCGERMLYVSVFDTETNCWLSSPRALSSSTEMFTQYDCVFAYNGELYMLAARPPQHNTIYLWKLNPVTFTWKRIQAKGKVPHTHCGMQCCVVGDRIVVFGSMNWVHDNLHILDLNTSLKTLCKLSVIQYNLEQSQLPQHVRWELAAMKTKEPEICPCGNSVGLWSSVHVHP